MTKLQELEERLNILSATLSSLFKKVDNLREIVDPERHSHSSELTENQHRVRKGIKKMYYNRFW